MATLTIVADTNWDAVIGATGSGDAILMNSGTLTIDTDSRYCANHDATTGVLGTLNFSATAKASLFLDGSKVRAIPYDTGSGTVPAIGTAITEGGVSASLLGVWSALNVPPTAVGGPMPASGWIKVKNKTVGSFSAGALGGISANATGPDITGWIEVALSGGYHPHKRLSTIKVRGEWFEAGTTSGARNQTVQLPASHANTFYGGAWIETSPGSGVFDFWPSAGAFVSANTGTDIRCKFVWISSQGLLRIGSDGANNVGLLPAAGCRIRVPNLTILTATTTNTAPAATMTQRASFYNGIGVIDVDKANWNIDGTFGYLNTSPASVTFANSSLLDGIYLSGVLSGASFSNGGVGSSANIPVTPLALYYQNAPSSFTDWTFMTGSIRSCATYSNSKYVSFTRCRFAVIGGAPSASCRANEVITAPVSDLAFTDCVFIGAYGFYGQIAGVSNLTFTRSSYAFHFYGAQGGTTGEFVSLGVSQNIVVDGLDFMGLANVHPTNCVIRGGGINGLKIRNFGTFASRLSLGSAAATNYLFGPLGGTPPINDRVEIQRCYLSNTGSALVNQSNVDGSLYLESVFGDYADAQSLSKSNTVARGCGFTASFGATLAFGTHWFDYHTSATAGKLVLLCNERGSSDSSLASYTITGGVPLFNSNGGAVFFGAGDEITWETPYWVIGHTGFANSAPTITYSAGSSLTIEYDLNKGSGYSGTWKALTQANIYAESAGINASTGFKIKYRVGSTGLSATLANIQVITTSTTTTQAYQYPLDLATLTLTGIVPGSDVVVMQAGTTTELTSVDQGGSTFNWQYDAGAVSSVDIGVFKAGYKPYVDITALALTAAGASVPVKQVVDRDFI